MAAIVALVAGIDVLNVPDVGQYRIRGVVAVQGDSGLFIDWETIVNFTDGSLAVNTACKDAAIAAVQTLGITVLPSDQKTLFGSAVIA